jgi:hypothetical protein
MEKEELFFSPVNPEVLQAHDIARKLFEDFRACTDPLTKQVFKGMVYDALDFEKDLKLKSQAQHAVNLLHSLETPVVSRN